MTELNGSGDPEELAADGAAAKTTDLYDEGGVVTAGLPVTPLYPRRPSNVQ